MPSDPRVAAVRERLRPAAAAFDALLATTSEDIRRLLAEQHASVAGGREALAASVGPFGTAHLDLDRLAGLLAADRAPAVDAAGVQTMEHALATLDALRGLGTRLLHTDVQAGVGLQDGVARALAEVGRAFGAARVVRAIRDAGGDLDRHARSLGSFPFARWSGAERRVAPPLMVEVDGEQLRPGGLAEFLDGALKLVLVVRGTAPPAPLVRLIAPRTFVAQAGTPDVVDRLLAWEGPGIVALMPEGGAAFVHDPAAGHAVGERLTVTSLPPVEARRRPLAGLSAAQQTEELDLLTALAAAPATGGTAAADADRPEAREPAPADRLAAWLLNQAEVSGGAGG